MLDLFRMCKYHILCTGFFQLIHLDLIPDHMPLHMAEYMLCFACLLHADRRRPIFLLYSITSSIVRCPSTPGSSYNPANSPFTGRLRIPLVSPSRKINTVLFSTSLAACLLLHRGVPSRCPFCVLHRTPLPDIPGTLVRHLAHRQLPPFQSVPD